MLEFYGQDVVGFGTFVTQFSNVVPSIQIWAQELHQKTEQNSGGTILENHDGRSAHKKCKRADCEPSQHEDLDSAYPLPDPTNFEPPNAGGGGGHTHTDTQTDTPGISGHQRSQYIQSMKMTEFKIITLKAFHNIHTTMIH